MGRIFDILDLCRELCIGSVFQERKPGYERQKIRDHCCSNDEALIVLKAACIFLLGQADRLKYLGSQSQL